jgi:sugar/nucleoside kinase (ribokinase family)
MSLPVPSEPLDYLIIGHLSCDLTCDGPRLGGTAAYAALMGRALGLRVGIVTAWGGEISLDVLDGINIQIINTHQSTTFENEYKPNGRTQIIHHIAPDLTFDNIPIAWRSAPIVHIAPIAGEAKTMMDGGFPSSSLVLTPQGWLRKWNNIGQVQPGDWPEAREMLSMVVAAVISIEDVGGDEDCIEAMADASKVLAVTEGPAGVRLYWNGDLRRFNAPSFEETDATGAGDIFSAAFFWRLNVTHDPWIAARFATCLASFSVRRCGLEGIPTVDEIKTCLVEVL